MLEQVRDSAHPDFLPTSGHWCLRHDGAELPLTKLPMKDGTVLEVVRSYDPEEEEEDNTADGAPTERQPKKAMKWTCSHPEHLIEHSEQQTSVIILPSHDMIFLHLQWFVRWISKKKNVSLQRLFDQECIVERAATPDQLFAIVGAKKERLWSIEVSDLNDLHSEAGKASIGPRKLKVPITTLHKSRQLKIVITTTW